MHWTESHWVTEERCIFQYEGVFSQEMLIMYGIMHFHVFKTDILSFFLTPPPPPLTTALHRILTPAKVLVLVVKVRRDLND